MELVVISINAEGEITDVIGTAGTIQVVVLDERVRSGRPALNVQGKAVEPLAVLQGTVSPQPEKAWELALSAVSQLQEKVHELDLSHQKRTQVHLTAKALEQARPA